MELQLPSSCLLPFVTALGCHRAIGEERLQRKNGNLSLSEFPSNIFGGNLKPLPLEHTHTLHILKASWR